MPSRVRNWPWPKFLEILFGNLRVLESGGNGGNSGNLGVWIGVKSGNSGKLALKMPDFQSSGNLTLEEKKVWPRATSAIRY